MKRILVILASTAALAFGAIDGTVANLTSGAPQAGAVVTLVELGGSMQNLGSAKSDASGKFHFDAAPNASTPYLIQALHQGVTYNKMLAPGTAGQPITLEVFDSSARVPNAKVTQDMILLERGGGQLIVNETVIYTNDGKTTFQSPDGTLKVQTPVGATSVKIRITAPQGMPVSREPEKGNAPNTWVVRYPIKPGETRIDLNYALPSPGDSIIFATKILHGGGPVRIVAPQGIKVESDSLTDLGPEPRTQATVYELKKMDFSINVSGEGQLRAAAGEAPESAQGGGEKAAAADTDTPGIDMVKPRIYQRLPWVVGLSIGMLTIGFIFLYNKGTSA